MKQISRWMWSSHPVVARRRQLVAQVVVLALLAPACLGLVALALRAASPPYVEASAAAARPHNGVVGKTPAALELRGSVDWGERGVLPVRLALVCDPDDRTSTARRARREGVVRIRLCLPGS